MLGETVSKLLILLHLLLLFICPFLEIWKFTLFNDNQLPLNEPLEYLYIALVFYQIVLHSLLCFCFHLFNIQRLKFTFISAGILWIIIPATYTYFTINELGDIPFLCPSDYNYYPTRNMQLICRVRASNLIIMWIRFIIILLISTIINFESEKISVWMGFIDDNNNKMKQNVIKKKQKRSRKYSRSGGGYEVGAMLVSLDKEEIES